MVEKAWLDDLARIEERLRAEMELHPVLAGTGFRVPPPALAAAFLSFYSFGAYQSEAAVQVGLALELLELAVSVHYPDIFDSGRERSIPESIDVITGDFFYSRALMAVAALNDSQVVRILAQAIASVAEAISKPITKDAIASGNVDRVHEVVWNVSALFAAAAELASYLGRLPEPLSGAVRKLAHGLGGIYHVREHIAKRIPREMAAGVSARFEAEVREAEAALAESGFAIDLSRILDRHS